MSRPEKRHDLARRKLVTELLGLLQHANVPPRAAEVVLKLARIHPKR